MSVNGPQTLEELRAAVFGGEAQKSTSNAPRKRQGRVERASHDRLRFGPAAPVVDLATGDNATLAVEGIRDRPASPDHGVTRIFNGAPETSSPSDLTPTERRLMLGYAPDSEPIIVPAQRVTPIVAHHRDIAQRQDDVSGGINAVGDVAERAAHWLGDSDVQGQIGRAARADFTGPNSSMPARMAGAIIATPWAEAERHAQSRDEYLQQGDRPAAAQEARQALQETGNAALTVADGVGLVRDIGERAARGVIGRGSRSAASVAEAPPMRNVTPSQPQPPPMLGGTPEALARARAQGWNVDQPLYHGTDRDISVFDPSRAGTRLPSDYGEHGTYLTPSPETASWYASTFATEPGASPNVMPVFTKGRIGILPEDATEQQVQRLRQKGYDGARIMRGSGHLETVMFNPSSIRSRFDSFDPVNARSTELLHSPPQGLVPPLTPPARQFQTASDGSVLPVRHQIQYVLSPHTGRQVEVLPNPSERDIARMLRDEHPGSSSARFGMSEDGTIYAWQGNDLLHYDVASAKGQSFIAHAETSDASGIRAALQDLRNEGRRTLERRQLAHEQDGAAFTPPARQMAQASGGSVLPVRPSEPFRNSLRGGSNDLMDAAQMQPAQPTASEVAPAVSIVNASKTGGPDLLAASPTDGSDIPPLSRPSVTDSKTMRMARAERMGFTVPARHATDQDITAFDPARIGSATDPGQVGRGFYMMPEQTARDWKWTRGIENEVQMPLLLRQRKPFNIVVTNHRPGNGKIEQLFDAPFDTLDQSIWNERSPGIFATDAMGATNLEKSERFTRALRSAGYDSVNTHFKDKPEDAPIAVEHMALNPQDIRSTHAAFDPRRSRSSDLLAGAGAITAGGAALSSPDDASAQELPPPGAQQLRYGANSVYLVPDDGRAPSFDSAHLQALGGENPDLLFAPSPDGGGVILRREGNDLHYMGRAWIPQSPFEPPPQDHGSGPWPILAGAAGSVVGGVIGRRYGARTGQEMLGSAFGGAAGGALMAGGYGLTTPQEDAAELAGYGAIFGAPTGAGAAAAGEAIPRAMGQAMDSAPTGVIGLPRRIGPRNPPEPIFRSRYTGPVARDVGPLDEGTLAAEMRLRPQPAQSSTTNGKRPMRHPRPALPRPPIDEAPAGQRRSRLGATAADRVDAARSLGVVNNGEQVSAVEAERRIFFKAKIDQNFRNELRRRFPAIAAAILGGEALSHVSEQGRDAEMAR